MPKPQSHELLQLGAEISQVKFPWDLIAPGDQTALHHDALQITQGRNKELDALIQQSRACHDARQRLAKRGLFSTWVEKETKLSRTHAWRLAACWERLGWYHQHALNQNRVSPLSRFDYGTLLYVLTNKELVPDPLLEELLSQTIDLIQSDKKVSLVSKKSVLDAAARYRRLKEPTKVYLGGQPSQKNEPAPEEEHMRDIYRVATNDTQKLQGAALPPVQAPACDEHGKPIPAELVHVFAVREHFSRLRSEIQRIAKEIHTLSHTAGGAHLHRRLGQRLLGVAEDLNLSCPALVLDTTRWASAKTLIRLKTRRSIYGNQEATRKDQPHESGHRQGDPGGPGRDADVGAQDDPLPGILPQLRPSHGAGGDEGHRRDLF